jgi:hypothetical protein
MIRRLVSCVAALAVVIAAATPAIALAHPGHKHTIMGTITMVGTGQVEVLDKNNEKTLFAITKKTKILVGKTAGAEKDLKVGSRIVVEAEEEEGEKFVAVRIQLPARAAE